MFPLQNSVCTRVTHLSLVHYGHAVICKNRDVPRYYPLPSSRVLSEKLTVAQLVNKLPVFYGTERFVTVFIRSATGPYPEPHKSNLHPLYFRKIKFDIILPSTPRSSHQAFQPKLCMHFTSRCMLRPSPFPSFDHPRPTELCSSPFLQHPVPSSILQFSPAPYFQTPSSVFFS
jgi:hypothetical protein